MPRRIELEPHLTTEELRARYRFCQKPQEKVRWHALYLISKGAVAADAARRLGRASSWITSSARRYNRAGASAVSRKRSARPSHRAKVDHKLGKELDRALRSSAPDGGLWTAPEGRGLDHGEDRASGSSDDSLASDASARVQPSSPAPSEQAARIG